MTSSAFPILPKPALAFREGVPYAEDVGDVYYSRENGLEESRHVFLRGNGLPEAFKGREHFTIGETGFGTGLNFLTAWQSWQETAPAAGRLTYVAVERAPLDREQMRQALEGWTGLAPLAQALLEAWPARVPGAHLRRLEGGRLRLLLLFGEAEEMLDRLEGRVDAWFLDGFSPAKNPAMWSEGVLRRVAARTRHGGTAASFTVAGAVRRGLESEGFAVEKRPGFGHKREMLAARMTGKAEGNAARKKRAAIIGAGLAGCAAAEALATRGWQVTLLDKGGAPAAGASGNPGAVMIPYFPGWDARGRLYAASWSYSLHLLAWLQRQGADIACGREGAVQAARQALLRERQAKYLRLGLPPDVLRPVAPGEMAELAGLPLAADAQGGLAFETAGWVHMGAWCRALLERAGSSVETRWGVDVARLERGEAGWRIEDQNGKITAEAPVVILAAGIGAKTLAGAPPLPLSALRGQMTRVQATATSARLKQVVHYGGYCLPAREGGHWLGSTFERGTSEPGPRGMDDAENIANARGVLGDALGNDVIQNWAGVRAMAPGRRPVIGAAGADWPGLYLTSGHGARGGLTCPYAAEVLAAIVEDAPRECYSLQK